MTSSNQSAKNRRLWIRLISIAVVVAIALVKPKVDEWLNKNQAKKDAAAQTDPDGAEKSAERNVEAKSQSGESANPSLDDLLADVQEDGDGSSKSRAKSGTKAGNSSAKMGNGSKTEQRKGAKSEFTTKSNPNRSGGEKKSTTKSSASGSTSAAKSSKEQPRLGKLTLIKGTRDEFRSTAGLMYLPGSADGHRLKHVLKHAKDNLSKPVHGVFDGDRDQILEWIDQTYVLGKKGGKDVRKEDQRGRTVYTANLKTRVGYVGGQKGKRNGQKECRYLKLVLENGTEVVTAYPADRM